MEEVARDIAAQVLLFTPRVLIAIVIFILFRIGASVARRFVRSFSENSKLDADVLNLMEQGAAAVLYIFGAITALGTIGINISALVASLGLTGFALGFALRDIVSNVIAGLLILIYEPFERNDFINVSGKEGTVAEIDLRYTTLMAEGEKILIPNATLFTNTIVVKTRKDIESEGNA